jgi:hypothetical protein
MVLFLLVDAFRASYLPRTKYLRRLAGQGALGSLREPFGFLPRAAYFAGLTPSEFGFSNIFSCNPAKSPFGMARWMGNPGSINEGAARQAITQEARQLLPKFAASYVSTLQIPVPWLRFFDLTEKYGPWEKRKGYRSIFDLLDEKKLPWFECSWPLQMLLPKYDDASIVENVIAQLRPEHALAYVHLTELDGLGHAHGPESMQMQRALMRSDALVQSLIEHCRKLDPECEVILFGDHGMLTVVQTFDLWAELNKLPLRFGEDYVFFLDSTMARFWFLRNEARAQVENLLRSVPVGKILEKEDQKRFAIEGCRPENGELIFLLQPGAVIHPNFFQREGAPPLGMHGYDPAVPDNEGILICHGPKTPGGTQLGEVDAVQLYPLMLDRLGLPVKENTAVPLPVPIPGGSRFTRSTLPGADEIIRRELKVITDAIQQKCKEPIEAVVLTGGFGRGEGSVEMTENGPRTLNDYDVMLVADHTESLKEMGRELAKSIGIDYVDLNYFRLKPEDFTATQLYYDIRYGSQVLAGDPDILDRQPPLAPADIPITEGYKIILNRMAGVMTSPFGFREKILTIENPQYLQNQIGKLLISLGDTYLFKWKAYDVSYEARAERFFSYAIATGMNKEWAGQIRTAYYWKLRPHYGSEDEAITFLQRALFCARQSFENLFGKDFAQPVEQMIQNLPSNNPGEYWQKKDFQRASELCLAHQYHFNLEAQNQNVRPVLYSTLLHLFLALDSKSGLRAEEVEKAAQDFEKFFVKTTEEGEISIEQKWDNLRKESVHFWEEICH